VYIVNYIVDDAPKAQIRGYSVSMADFLLEARQPGGIISSKTHVYADAHPLAMRKRSA
jgi:hypothetical protein